MAQYKPIHTGLKLLPVDFDQQVISDSFEHALCHLVDHELDLDEFHACYKNDDEGAPAFGVGSLLFTPPTPTRARRATKCRK